MAQLTRSGVAYNFTQSPYKACIHYSATDSIIYTFSSAMYRDKFTERLERNRERIHLSLTKRFNFKVYNNKLSDLQLYMSIEKRGFLIEDNKGIHTCPDCLKLDGLSLTTLN